MLVGSIFLTEEALWSFDHIVVCGHGTNQMTFGHLCSLYL